MRDTKLSDSPSARPLRPAEGLSASAQLAIGGVLWLVLSFALSCWVYWRSLEADPEPQPLSSAAQPLSMHAPGLAASHAAGPFFDRALALQTVDALVAHLLPLALPEAQWQLAAPPYGSGDRTGQDPYVQAAASPAAETSALPPATDTLAATGPAAAPGDDSLRQYVVSGPCAPLRLGLALLEGLRARQDALQSAGARASVRWSPQATLEVLLNNSVCCVFAFPGREGQLADLAQPLPAAALAVIIDDMGQKTAAADEAAALLFPVTFAIWPKAPHAAETADIAASRRLDCLLHQPMEALPRADLRRPDPGPGALLTSMSAQQIRAVVEQNLRAVPTVIGLNNHMGSAFTGDISLCEVLAGVLGERGLAVIDSVTRPDPQLAVAARKAGLVALARDVFLDTRRDAAAISLALDAAAARARAHGMAVAIGHPHPETLRALRDWQDKDGVAVVPLRRIIWKLAQDSAVVAGSPYPPNINMEKE